MKTKIFISLLICISFIYLMSSNLFGQEFTVDPPIKPLGDVNRGSNIDFDLVVTDIYDGVYSYSVTVNSVGYFLTAYPTQFEINYAAETQIVHISGVVPNDAYLGWQSFEILFQDDNNLNNYVLVSGTYNVLPGVGVDDYIIISQYNSSFSEGDPLHCHAIFYSFPPYYDAMSSWNLNMEIYPIGQSHTTYANIDKSGAPTMEADWVFNADPLPSNVGYIRNTDGRVLGKLKVSGYDESGYYHSDDRWFGINKEPTVPYLGQRNMDGNSINLIYNSWGATNYTIYYDTHQGPPYNGTGATQGPSPISAGTNTTFQISGLQQCVPYYFTIKGNNSSGTSVYSNETEVLLFNTPNQNPIDYFLNDLVINYNYVLTKNYYFTKNLIIEPGYTLTVNGSFLYFNEGSQIIIKPGSKLILNGATCTSPCGQSWQGIEVWGDYNQHQYTINGNCAQGTLILNANSVIENANNIALWNPYHYLTAGGIIQATGATFKNNRKAAEFISYHNFNPYSNKRTDNLSYFSNCQFIIDTSYLLSIPFSTFISMWDVEGIKINGCSFKNLKAFNNNSNRGYGIYSMDAKYNVKSYCSSQLEPCPAGSLIRSDFQGLYAGIAALNNISTKTIYVNDAVFTDNSYGIKLDAVSNARIIFSDFYIGPNTNCSNFTGIGVELNNCNGYSVEENNFTFSNTWPIGANFIGIRVLGPEDPPLSILYNEIYHNQFIGITAGNVAEGINGIFIPPFDGLCYICNNNQHNVDYDFYIKTDGVAMYQGSDTEPAGNVFAHTGLNPYSDINMQAGWPIDYTYYSGNPGSPGVPGEEPIYTYNVIINATSNQNPCLPNYGSGNQTLKLTDNQIIALVQQFANNAIAYDNVLALYELLKDGGSTEEMEADIISSNPSQTMELRDELLGSSPHLSQDVLKTAAENYDVLPDPILFEILLANPDELRNEELLAYLAERTPPFPDYMIELLRVFASDSSYKTTLQKQLSSFSANKTKAVYALLRDMLIDTVPDLADVRNWLDNLQNIQADYQIIDSWLEQGNATLAMALVNMLPQLYTMDIEAQAEYDLYNDLKTIQSALINEEKNVYELSQAQITELEGIAQNSKGLAGVQARNILSFAYGYAYLNCAEIMDPSEVKSAKTDRGALLKKMYEPQVTASPNPARDWAAFSYDIPTSVDNASLRINNLKGQLITTLPVKTTKGEVIWDTREVVPGIYCYTLTNGKFSTTGKIAVVH